MFIGRKQECRSLQAALRDLGTAVMIYGKRKVGKTTLIREVLNQRENSYFYYECVKGTQEENLNGIANELVLQKFVPARISFPSFQDLFSYLNATMPGLTVVIDEYPYLKAVNDAELIDSIFQNVIDNRIAQLNLIISGSHIGMMRDMLEEKNALYGRFHTVIRLRELTYKEAADFYPDRTAYDKAAFYSVFGGSPYVNRQLNPELTLEENLVQTLLNQESTISLYAEHLLISDFSNQLNAERIFSALGNGKKTYGELERALHMERNGALNRQLKPLIEMEFVNRKNPLNKADDNKKSMYSINDNLLRFYYSYVHRNKGALEMLGEGGFYNEYIMPTLTEFISHRFEDIVKDYFSELARKGQLPGVRNIGAYYYDDPIRKKNGEFDVALMYSDTCSIIEVKYFNRPMRYGEMCQEADQIRAIPGVAVKTIGFVSANGFERTEGFEPCLTVEDLYA